MDLNDRLELMNILRHYKKHNTDSDLESASYRNGIYDALKLCQIIYNMPNVERRKAFDGKAGFSDIIGKIPICDFMDKLEKYVPESITIGDKVHCESHYTPRPDGYVVATGTDGVCVIRATNGKEETFYCAHIGQLRKM